MASEEDDIIATHFAPLAGEGAFGLTDDAACFAVPAGWEVVATKDALVAGVHFFPDDPPDAIARKALRVNLSDLAAKGAEPVGFLLSIALAPGIDSAWLARFAEGLGGDSRDYGCPLLGGDTVSTPGPLALSVTALGRVPAGAMVRRAGAKIGDVVFVTGTIGDAALGLALRLREAEGWSKALKGDDRARLLDRYLLPRPRNALATALRRSANAAMDVSDGLVGDLSKLCRVSGVGAVVETARVPLSGAARRAVAAEPALLPRVLTGGDDYEVVGTASEAGVAALAAAADRVGVPITRIGAVAAASTGVVFADAAGQPFHFAQASYSHRLAASGSSP